MWVVIFFSFSSRLYAFFIRRTWFFFLPLISNINLSDHNAQTLQPPLSQRVLPFTLPFSCMSIRCKNLLLGFKIMCKSSSWTFGSSPGNISNPDDLSAQPWRILKGILCVWCFRRIWVRRRWFHQCQFRIVWVEFYSVLQQFFSKHMFLIHRASHWFYCVLILWRHIVKWLLLSFQAGEEAQYSEMRLWCYIWHITDKHKTT